MLEGSKEKLSSLFSKIKEDDMHKNIFVIPDKKIDQRVFNEYKSGFDTIQTKDDQSFKKYLSQYKCYLPSSKSILEILEPFLL